VAERVEAVSSAGERAEAADGAVGVRCRSWSEVVVDNMRVYRWSDICACMHACVACEDTQTCCVCFCMQSILTCCKDWSVVLRLGSMSWYESSASTLACRSCSLERTPDICLSSFALSCPLRACKSVMTVSCLPKRSSRSFSACSRSSMACCWCRKDCRSRASSIFPDAPCTSVLACPRVTRAHAHVRGHTCACLRQARACVRADVHVGERACVYLTLHVKR